MNGLQKRMKRLLAITLVFGLSTLPCSKSYAIDLSSGEIKQVIELLNSCHEVVGACRGAIKSKDAQIKAQRGLLNLKEEELARMRAEKTSIFRNPFLWAGVGLLLGVGVVIGLK